MSDWASLSHEIGFRLRGSLSLAMDTIQTVIEALERAPRIVVPLVREMPPALVKTRPTAERWSAHEHACHLAVVHEMFFDRLDYLLAVPTPTITPYDPGTNDSPDRLLNLDLERCLESYERDRTRLAERIRRLTPAEWVISAEHPEYSHYSVFIMFRHLALHDFLHAYRIEELVLKREWA